MTDVLVERLRIACRAPHPRRAEALALRTRLERVAQRHLPSTLADASVGVGDDDVGAVTVTLDFDPTDYDDVTVALLWADRIRRAVLAAQAHGGAVVRRDVPDRVPGTAAPERSREPWTLLVERALTAADDDPVLDELVASLDGGGEEGVRQVVERIALARRRLLAERLLRLAARLEAEHAAADGSHARDEATDATTSTRRDGERATRDEERDPHGSAERVASLRRAAAQLRRRAERAPRPASSDMRSRADDAARLPEIGLMTTDAAGIVLPYPWLASFLAVAMELHPQLESVAVRRLALARLVPDLWTADEDPLVRFLAGDDPGRPAVSLEPLPDVEAVDAAAEEVLRAFARALPGFEHSTAEFVRRELIVRRGVLSLETGELLADSMPLDVVLTRLPYPIGLVKLPGSPLLSIRLARG